VAGTWDLLWLIPALPLAGFAINALLALVGSRSEHGPNRKICALVGVLAPGVAFAIAIAATFALWNGPTRTSMDLALAEVKSQGLVTEHRNYQLADGTSFYDPTAIATEVTYAPRFRQDLWTWFEGEGWELPIALEFDQLSALMLLFILGISTLIHLYSIGYMADDRGFARFFAYLNLFVFSMVMLVMGSNLILTFLGWEGVGLCSYLLIGFWNRDDANCAAANKAFVMNRIGDLGFVLGTFALFAVMGDAATFEYEGIRGWFRDEANLDLIAGSTVTGGLLTAAALLLFLGCAGKSAQIPLFTWLPDAMAGPTPVSALIHAATMVTAGVYLMARLGDVFVVADAASFAILVVAMITALYAAVIGLFQWDIKKILAYSTVSQLGFMFLAAGVGAYDVAIFHVFTHAFFKATLFLGAGSVIHACHHEQDVRRMGGLAKRMPITHAAMFFAWYAIIGLPLGSGFMSKDLILERLSHYDTGGKVFYSFALLGALLTAIYMTRFMFLVFWSRPRMDEREFAQVREPPVSMGLPVLLLGLGSMIAGVFWMEIFPGSHRFQAFLAPTLAPAVESAHMLGLQDLGVNFDSHALAAGAISSVVAGIGAVIAFVLWRGGPRDAEVRPLTGIPALVTHAFDHVYRAVVVVPVQVVAAVSLTLHIAVVERIPEGLARLAQLVGHSYRGFQRSRLRTSLALSAAGVIALMAFVLLEWIRIGG